MPKERFRVGVSGHRQLPADGAVPVAVTATLDGLAAAAGDRWPAVVSSLAEGADRLVAEDGLARGWALEAVLPLEPTDYSDDFADPASVEAFEWLLAAADEIEVVAPRPTRVEAYLAAGLAVVDRCDVLLALWDGEPARGTGGTAEIVDRARAEGRPLVWVRVPSGDVVHERWPWAS